MAKKYSYWELRKIQYEQANFIEDTKFLEWLNTEYDNALNEINKEIYKYLSNIAEDNQISISDAKKLLNNNELKEFKMGLKLFTEKAQGNISKEVELALNNASHRFRISRLQAVETMIKGQVDNLLNVEQKAVFDHLGKKYLDTYYHMTYDLQSIKGYNHIQGINERKLNAILNKPWAEDNKNFSQRIWGRNNKIVNELQRQLTQSIIRGKDLKDIAKDIAKSFETSKSNATRLIYTESAAFTSMADEASYKETGLEKYKVLATLDNRTSETCREMDGKVFHLKDYKIFVTAPPFHIRCRSTTVPEFDDFLQDETRAMRNPNTGKSERIPYMNYDDWYKKHVVSNPEALLKEQMYKNKLQDKKNV